MLLFLFNLYGETHVYVRVSILLTSTLDNAHNVRLNDFRHAQTCPYMLGTFFSLLNPHYTMKIEIFTFK